MTPSPKTPAEERERIFWQARADRLMAELRHADAGDRQRIETSLTRALAKLREATCR